jgi:hypothetical protein
VDIYRCTDDDDGGYFVGAIVAGEWLTYTLDVGEDGEYDVELRMASPVAGTLHVEFDGRDATGTIQVPRTGDWNKWETTGRSGIHLNRGERLMRIAFDTAQSPRGGSDVDYCNLNWIRLSKSPAPASAPTGGR